MSFYWLKQIHLSRSYSLNIYGTLNTEKKVYLTSDDGPISKLQNGF
jgi:peptidoglycan/xylan/chitin deacetylase (PgdA/CDA1 family)